ncbi:MAG: hypothetical protein JO180_11400 [Gemmatirosa sp.]|nr:hypothetical protein [Gemmatirosa sp.]
MPDERPAWRDRCLAVGLDDATAQAAATRFVRAAQALARLTGDAAPPLAYWVPGRVELLGKHTDYAGGRSLVCTLGRGFAVAAAPRRDARVRIIDSVSGVVAETAIDPDASAAPAHWSNYPITVARRIARNFPGARFGADLALASDLPSASGLSSSSALVVATFLVLAAANNLASHDVYRASIGSCEALAAYLGAVESGRGYESLLGDHGVGTLGGAQDHTAILCTPAGAIAEYAYAPVRLERVIPFPAGHTLVIAASGVTAHKAGRARTRYNEASLAVAELLARWHAAGGTEPTLDAVVAVPGAVDALRAMLVGHPNATRLGERLTHFVAERVEIVPAASDALARGDYARFGELVDRSQWGAEHLLRNQVPETVWLARRARELDATAASAFGAGFGGSVWALVPNGSAEAFVRRWRADYVERFRRRAGRSAFFATMAGPAATRL